MSQNSTQNLKKKKIDNSKHTMNKQRSRDQISIDIILRYNNIYHITLRTNNTDSVSICLRKQDNISSKHMSHAITDD